MKAAGRAAAVAIVAAIATATCGNSPPPEASSASAAESSSGGASGSGSCPSTVSFTPQVDDHGVAAASGASIALTAGDSYFSPTCMTAVSAGTVTLTIHNGGVLLHNISVPDQNVDTDIAVGATVTVRVAAGSAPLLFFCKYHRTSGMQGALLPAGH